jgi:hypothetical protein
MRTITVISILGSSILGPSILGLAAGTATADTESEPEPRPAVAATAAKTRTIGVDAGIAMPTGDFSDSVGFGLGALVRFEMPLRPNLVLTARAGYLHHMAKERDGGQVPGGGGGSEVSVGEIPVLGGLRYAFSQKPTSSIYGVAELGFVHYRISLDANGQSMTSSDTNLGMALGAGYRTGKLDLRAGLYFPKADELTDAMELMATVGYDLTAF